MIKFFHFCLVLSALAMVSFPSSAQEQTVYAVTSGAQPVEEPVAQNVALAPSGEPSGNLETTSSIEKEISDRLMLLQPKVDVNQMPSLFFSDWEHDLIVDARRGLVTRPPGDDGLGNEGERDIALGGIVYVSSDDWTIWLNGTRVTPNAIPADVMDLKVYKEYVELEWFDAPTNQIFPIRLRAHQRFNLDTRIFLPG